MRSSASIVHFWLLSPLHWKICRSWLLTKFPFGTSRQVLPIARNSALTNAHCWLVVTGLFFENICSVVPSVELPPGTFMKPFEKLGSKKRLDVSRRHF